MRNTREDFVLLMIMAGICGFLGGMAVQVFGSAVSAVSVSIARTTEADGPPAAVVRARRFELVDPEGKVRGRLEMGPSAMEASLQSILPEVAERGEEAGTAQAVPRLSLLDEEGRVRITVDLFGLYLYNRQVDPLPQVRLDLSPAGMPGLSVRAPGLRVELPRLLMGLGGLVVSDGQGAARLALGVSEDGRPGVALVDKDQRVRIGMALFARERPGLFFYDGQGQGRSLLGLTEAGEPLLALYDRLGRERILLGMGRSENEPSVALYGEGGQPAALIGSTALEAEHRPAIGKRPVNSIVLFDENSGLLWSAPPP